MAARLLPVWLGPRPSRVGALSVKVEEAEVSGGEIATQLPRPNTMSGATIESLSCAGKKRLRYNAREPGPAHEFMIYIRVRGHTVFSHNKCAALSGIGGTSLAWRVHGGLHAASGAGRARVAVFGARYIFSSGDESHVQPASGPRLPLRSFFSAAHRQIATSSSSWLGG